MAAPAPTSSSERLWQIDALRGLMLVLMTLTHLPTRVADPAGQPFGFVSAAEGFVLLSGFMAGMVYAAREQRDGETVMRAAFFQRVVKIYLCQAALLLFLFTFVALLAVVLREEAIIGLMRFYLEQPLTALVGGLLLLYSPPLLDILPMYIVFMLVSPLVLLHGLRRGWGGIMACSVLLWFGAQFDLGEHVYEWVAGVARVPVPIHQTGAFDILAWQFLWVLGLWLGAERTAARTVPAFPRWMLLTAIVVAVCGFVWRHAVGQVPVPNDAGLNMLFDKWQLAPVRMLNLFALLVLLLHGAPWLARHLPRLRVLEMLGAASLPVFCAHLVLALLALALFGAVSPDRSLLVDAVVLVGSFVALLAVGWGSQELDRQAAALRSRKKLKAQQRAVGAQPLAPGPARQTR